MKSSLLKILSTVVLCTLLIFSNMIPTSASIVNKTPSISGKVESNQASSQLNAQKALAEKTKLDFSKTNKITLQYLNNVLSGKVSDPKIWEKFYNQKNQKNIDDILQKYQILKNKTKSLIATNSSNTNDENSELAFLEKRIGVISNTTNLLLNNTKATTFAKGSDNFNISNQYTKLMKQVSVAACTPTSLLPIAYNPGDILVTSAGKDLPGPFNTWHAAIIIDKSSVAEAPGPNLLTRKSDVSKWCNIKGFTTLGFVNYGNSAQETRAANNASSWLIGRPYPADPTEYLRDPWDITTVYCSGLVWRAYAQDVNLASYNRAGNLVTPQNLIDDDNTLFLKYWAHI